MRVFPDTQINESEKQALFQLEIGINGFDPVVDYDFIIKLRGYNELSIMDKEYYNSFIERNNFNTFNGSPLFLASVEKGTVKSLNLTNLGSIVKGENSYLTDQVKLLKNCNHIYFDRVGIGELCEELLELKNLKLVYLSDCFVKEDDYVVQLLRSRGVKVTIEEFFT